MNEYLTIRIDSREQHPLPFDGDLAAYCRTMTGPLPWGDYSLEYEAAEWYAAGGARSGRPYPWAVERKSMEDFVASIMSRGEHEKLVRAMEHGQRPLVYVVEGDESGLRPARDIGGMRVGYDYGRHLGMGAAAYKVVLSRLFTWRIEADVQVVFAGDRLAAAAYVVKLLQRRARAADEAARFNWRRVRKVARWVGEWVGNTGRLNTQP